MRDRTAKIRQRRVEEHASIIPLGSNLIVWVGKAERGQAETDRVATPLIVCDSCKRPVTAGADAYVLIAADRMPEYAHPALPVIVHRDCLEAFHAKHPTRWAGLWTVSDYVRSLLQFTHLDAVLEERAAKGRKKKGKPGLHA